MNRWKLTCAVFGVLAAAVVLCHSGWLSQARAAGDGLAQQPPAGGPAKPHTVNPKRPPAGQPAAPRQPQAPGKVTMGGGEFAENAFPPTVSDVDYHNDAWMRDDCLRCHETGVGDAPMTRHEGMPKVLLSAKCRSCHVLVPGQKPAPKKEYTGEFTEFSFPPMIPASESHKRGWMQDDCLLCHEDGVRGAPIVKHKGMPSILLTAKCRSCHVQVRSATIPGR